MISPVSSDQIPASSAGESLQVIRSKVVRGSLWTLVNLIVSTPVALLVNAIVARALGVADYGRLAMLTAAIAISAQVANLSMSDGGIQWGAGAHSRGDAATVSSLLRKTLGYQLMVTAPLLCLTVLILAGDEAPLVVAGLMLSVALPAFCSSATMLISIENRTATGAQITLAAGMFTQLSVAVTALTTHSAVNVWAARSIIGSLLLPLNFVVLDRYRRRMAMRAALPRGLPNGFWTYCGYATATGLITGIALSRSEVFVLNGFDWATEAGLFALAFGLSQQVTAPIDALAGPLLPAVTSMVQTHPRSSPQNFLQIVRVTATLSSCMLAGVVPAVYFAIPLVYGEQYSRAGLPFVALAMASFLQSSVLPCLAFTRARGRNDLIFKSSIAALLVDVAIASSVIPRLPLLGAVAANVISFTTFFVVLTVIEARHLGVVGGASRAVGLPLLAASNACLGTVVTLGLVPGPPWLACTLAPGFGYFLHAVLCRSSRLRHELADLEGVIRRLPPRVRGVARLAFRPLG